MHPTLETLAKLYVLDRDYKRLAMDVSKHGKAQEAARQAHTDALAAQQAVADTQAELKQRSAKLTRDVETYNQRLKSAQRVLQTGAGDPDAAQRQIDQVEGILDTLETDQLEVMEQQDAAEQAKQQAADAVRAAQAALAEADETHPTAIAALKAKAADNRKQHAPLLASLEREDRHKYETVLKRKGAAVAPIINGSCKACAMVVQSQQLADLENGRIEPCRGCGRWLVFETLVR